MAMATMAAAFAVHRFASEAPETSFSMGQLRVSTVFTPCNLKKAVVLPGVRK